MAGMVFLSTVARSAAVAAASLHREATLLRERNTSIDSNNLLGFMDRMRDTYLHGIEPLRVVEVQAEENATEEQITALRATVVNDLVKSLTIRGPEDTYERIVDMRQAIMDLAQAYNDSCFVFSGFAAFDFDEGARFASITDLSPLYPSLDKLIQATSVYV